MKKKKLLIVLIGLFSIAVLTVLFLYVVLPQWILRHEIDIHPNDKIQLSNKAANLHYDLFCYSYEIEFASSEYNNIMDKVFKYEYTTISLDVNSFPKEFDEEAIPKNKKYWMDIQYETVIWWNELHSAEVIVTQDAAGGYHAYIDWWWSPLWFMIN